MTRGAGQRFELREHTADVAVAATGETLEAVFAAVADGLAAASCDEIPDGVGERFSLSVTAESREALLFDYLDELIYLRDVRAALPVDHRVDRIERIERSSDDSDGDGNGHDGSHGSGDESGDGDGVERGGGDESEPAWTLEASTRGVPLGEIDAREVKAVTYSEMRLERVDASGGDGNEDADTAEGAEDGDWEAYVVFDV